MCLHVITWTYGLVLCHGTASKLFIRLTLYIVSEPLLLLRFLVTTRLSGELQVAICRTTLTC